MRNVEPGKYRVDVELSGMTRRHSLVDIDADRWTSCAFTMGIQLVAPLFDWQPDPPLIDEPSAYWMRKKRVDQLP